MASVGEAHAAAGENGEVIQEDQNWILACFAVIIASILAYLLKPVEVPEEKPTPRVPTKKEDLTLKQLRKYNGKNGKPMYVAVKGIIFNVSSHPSGVELYGPDSPYNVFAGREATVGLARGNYDIEEEYDLKDLSMLEFDTLEQWFHWTFKAKYDEVGKVLPPNEDSSEEDNDDAADEEQYKNAQAKAAALRPPSGLPSKATGVVNEERVDSADSTSEDDASAVQRNTETDSTK